MGQTQEKIEVSKEKFDKLLEERERFKLVLEGTRLGMWDWNPMTNEVVFDKYWCEMLGYEFGEIKNNIEEWSSRVHPDDIDQCYSDIQKHIDGEEEFYENVHRMKHKDGSWRYILDRGRIMKRDEDGNVIRFTGTHTDITKEREATLQAIQSKKAKDLFFSMMSHELRTPLTSIIAAFSLVEKKRAQYKEISTLLDITKYSTEYLKNLIDNLLDYQKIEMFSIELNEAPFSINELFDNMQTLFAGKAEIQGAGLKIENKLQHDYYNLDKTRLSQILINLVSNALKYIEEGGLVAIKAMENHTHKKGNLLFQVIDNGVGIDNKLLAKIFLPFEQVNNVDQNTGTGLGLTLNKELVDLMGGEIWVESQLGKGSSFFFTIQAEQLEQQQENEKADEVIDLDHYNLSKLNILVAEDDKFIALLYKVIFKHLGITNYKLARHGEEALEMFKEGKYNLVFSDWYMPKLDGLGLVSEIRKCDNEVKVIGCSANVSKQDTDKFYDAGVNYLLTKPFDIDKFKLTLENIMKDFDKADFSK